MEFRIEDFRTGDFVVTKHDTFIVLLNAGINSEDWAMYTGREGYDNLYYALRDGVVSIHRGSGANAINNSIFNRITNKPQKDYDWECIYDKEDFEVIIDGVKYSKSTLRSLIRKATSE